MLFNVICAMRKIWKIVRSLSVKRLVIFRYRGTDHNHFSFALQCANSFLKTSAHLVLSQFYVETAERICEYIIALYNYSMSAESLF